MVALVRQRSERDCGVGALAMLAGIDYEDADVAAAKVDPVDRGKEGLTNAEVIRIARLLKFRLTPTRKFDLDADEGILRVRFTGPRAKTSPGGHFVTIRKAMVLCPADYSVLPWPEYMERWNARACTLLFHRRRRRALEEVA
jgi:hypothetical protein